MAFMSRSVRLFLLLTHVCLGVLLPAQLLQAQTAKLFAQEGTSSKVENKENVDSPRYMVRQFLNVMKREDVEAALTFMEFPRRWNKERRHETTRQLIEVLNKKGHIDLGDISDAPDGRINDGQPADIEVIGQI